MQMVPFGGFVGVIQCRGYLGIKEKKIKATI